MLADVLTVFNLLAGLVILFESLAVMNQMTKYTPHKLRFTYAFLAMGGFYTALEPHVLHLAPLALNLATAYLIMTVRFNRCGITGSHKALRGV